jgi:hypothetical protein
MSAQTNHEVKSSKKTADMAAYMREYRLANIEKCRKQDRDQYHLSKHKEYVQLLTPEQLEQYKDDLKTVCNIIRAIHIAKENYPELLTSII